MNIFLKIVYKTIPVNIPDYLTLYSGDSRLRRTLLDNLSFVSNIASMFIMISILLIYKNLKIWFDMEFEKMYFYRKQQI